MSDKRSSMQNNKTKRTTISVIPDALKYYDRNTEKYSKLVEKIKYISGRRIEDPSQPDKEVASAKETDHVEYSFYDADKNYLFTSRIEYVGKYFENQNIWVWAWALAAVNKSTCTIIRNVFLYGTDINVYSHDSINDENLILRNELVTSRSIITDKIQIDIHCALASYLSKKPFILPLVMSKLMGQNIDYIPYEQYDVINFDDAKIDSKDYEKNHIIVFMYILDPPDV